MSNEETPDLTAPGANSGADANLKSRGNVVMSALEAKSAAAAIDALSNLEAEAYNPFQLLVADGRDAFLLVYRDRPIATTLEPGAHIVGNVVDPTIEERLRWEATERAVLQAGPEEPRAIKLTRIRARVEKMLTESEVDLFEGLARTCREHLGAGAEKEDHLKSVDGEGRSQSLRSDVRSHFGSGWHFGSLRHAQLAAPRAVGRSKVESIVDNERAAV